jgi:hypothetical protein
MHIVPRCLSQTILNNYLNLIYTLIPWEVRRLHPLFKKKGEPLNCQTVGVPHFQKLFQKKNSGQAVRMEGSTSQNLVVKLTKKSSLCQQFVQDLFYPFLTCIRDCLAHKILRISSRDYPEHCLDASAGI